MTTVYDVPPNALIDEVAKLLAKEKEIEAPAWAPFVKTGIHTEKPPVDDQWWFTRVAAVLRKVYTDGPVGTERLRHHFGGYRDRGSMPNKAAKGSGSIARKALQQLEAAGLVANVQGQGRAVTGKGRGLLDNAAHTVRQVVQKDTPSLLLREHHGRKNCASGNSRNSKHRPKPGTRTPARRPRPHVRPNRMPPSSGSCNRSWTPRRASASPASA